MLKARVKFKMVLQIRAPEYNYYPGKHLTFSVVNAIGRPVCVVVQARQSKA